MTIETITAQLERLQTRRNSLSRQQQEKAAEAETLRGQLTALLENFEGADADAERARLSARIGALGVEAAAVAPVIQKLDAEMTALSRQQQALLAERASDAHEQAIADARAASGPIVAAVRTFVSETLPPLVAAWDERHSALVQAARVSRQAAAVAGVTPRHTVEHINFTDGLPLNIGLSLRQLLAFADDYRQQLEYSEKLKADRAAAAA